MHEYELWVVVRGSGDGNGARVACLLLGARGEVSVETWPRKVFWRQNSNSQGKERAGDMAEWTETNPAGSTAAMGRLWKFGSLMCTVVEDLGSRCFSASPPSTPSLCVPATDPTRFLKRKGKRPGSPAPTNHVGTDASSPSTSPRIPRQLYNPLRICQLLVSPPSQPPLGPFRIWRWTLN